MTPPGPAGAPHRLAGDRAPERLAPREQAGVRRGRAAAIAVSLGVHGAILAALFLFHPKPSPMPEPPPVDVALVVAPRPPLPGPPLPPGPPAAAAKAKAKAVVPPPPVLAAHRAPLPPPPEVKTVAAAKAPAMSVSAELTAAEIAGAATAGSGGAGEGSGGGGGGGGGGACNMIRRIQAALRKDHLVLAAAGAPETAGKALKVWDGDWVQHTGQDGRGLAAVREAIMWEVGFAPPACRAESVHGLVLFSLGDGPGATRLALGSGAWRWSDLLTTRGVGGR